MKNMALVNNAPTENTIGITSRSLAEYRKGLNRATWLLSSAMTTNANPDSANKMQPSLWSQARGILPNMLIIPALNMDMKTGTFFTTPSGADLQRAGIQVSFLQSQLKRG